MRHARVNRSTLIICALPVQQVWIGADTAAPEAVGGWGWRKDVFLWVGDFGLGIKRVVDDACFFVAREVDADRNDGLEAVGAGHGGDVWAVVLAWWVED